MTSRHFKCNLCVQMLFLGHSMSTHISVTAAVVIVSLAAVLLLQTAFLSHTGTYRQLQLWFSLFNTFTVSLLVTRVKRLSSVLSWNGKCSQSGHCFSENNSLESTVSVEIPNIRETIFRYLKNNFFVPYNQRLFCVILPGTWLQVWIIYSVGKCGIAQSVFEQCCVDERGWSCLAGL